MVIERVQSKCVPIKNIPPGEIVRHPTGSDLYLRVYDTDEKYCINLTTNKLDVSNGECCFIVVKGKLVVDA